MLLLLLIAMRSAMRLVCTVVVGCHFCTSCLLWTVVSITWLNVLHLFIVVSIHRVWELCALPGIIQLSIQMLSHIHNKPFAVATPIWVTLYQPIPLHSCCQFSLIQNHPRWKIILTPLQFIDSFLCVSNIGCQVVDLEIVVLELFC